MNYAAAKAIAAEHAPNLLVDEHVEGAVHICVRKSEGGHPFSIMLPLGDGEDDKKMLTDALDAATKHLPD